jgi:hypothetical protein
MTTEVNETSAAPAEGEALPEEVQTVAQDEAEATAADKQEESSDDGAAEAKKAKGGFQRRIDELTRQREEERREKDRLLSLVERLSGSERQKPQETQAQGTPEPKRDDFDDYEAYLEARAEYRAVRALETRLQQQEAQRAQQAHMTEQQKQVAAWNARLAEARSKLPDFDDVTAADVPITQSMSSAIMDSDKGAEVAYYLGNHPAEAARIAALSPIGQVREIGKLEDRVSAKPVKPSNAPDPIKPVGARSSGSDPLSDKLPMDQWARNFEKEFYKNRR